MCLRFLDTAALFLAQLASFPANAVCILNILAKLTSSLSGIYLAIC